MNSDTILDGRLWARTGFDHAPTENRIFRDDSSNVGHFAIQSLLYDKFVFPTNDFGIVPILANWIGIKSFLKAVEDGTFSFIKHNQILTYSHLEGGIARATLREGSNKPLLPWMECMFGELDKALAIQLKLSNEIIPAEERNQVYNTVIKASREYNLSEELFNKNIVNETYSDIIDSPLLTSMIKSNVPAGDRLDLARLPGLNANQIKIFSLKPLNDSISLVLRIAEVNLEIAMASSLEKCDLFTCIGADKLMLNKLRRIGLPGTLASSFFSLLELNNLPDIEQGICDHKITIKEIWKVRKTKESKQFREWLRKVNVDDIRELEKEYVAALCKIPVIASLPARIIRLCVTSALSIEPLSGLAAGAIDNFFVDKMMSGYNPKLFFDRLRKLDLSN